MFPCYRPFLPRHYSTNTSSRLAIPGSSARRKCLFAAVKLTGKASFAVRVCVLTFSITASVRKKTWSLGLVQAEQDRAEFIQSHNLPSSSTFDTYLVPNIRTDMERTVEQRVEEQKPRDKLFESPTGYSYISIIGYSYSHQGI